jgi:hypothetical protein
MATEVFTGWRTVRPGACDDCGFDDGWECDGSGTITCECEEEVDDSCGVCGEPMADAPDGRGEFVNAAGTHIVAHAECGLGKGWDLA